MQNIEKNLDTYPALWRLQALAPGGLGALPSTLAGALERGDYSGALKLANERYARRADKDAAATLIYACLLLGRELVMEARGVLGRALESRPRDGALRALMADAHLQEGDAEHAREILAAIIPQKLARAQAAAFIADLYLDLGDESLGDESRAIEFYQHALHAGLDDPEPAIRLGQLYIGRDQPFEAAEALEHAARLSKTRVGLWQMVAEQWMELGEEERGLTAKLRAMRLGEPDAEDWLELAYEFAQVGAHPAALDALDKVEQLLHQSVRTASADQLYVDAQLVRGEVCLEMGRPEQAMAAFHHLERRAGTHPAAQRGLAEAALALGDLDLARDAASRALALRPEDADARYILGCALQQFGRHADALAQLERAVTHEDAPPAWYSALALSYALTQQFAPAQQYLAMAVEIVQGYPEFSPLQVDFHPWQRLVARLKADNHPLAAWFEAQINILSAPAS